MRKFLDLVVRDDRPILTPPSEDESEYNQLDVNDYANGHQETDLPVTSNTTDKVNNLKQKLEGAVSITDHASTSKESFHETHLHAFHTDTRHSVKHGPDFTVSPSQVRRHIPTNFHQTTAETSKPSIPRRRVREVLSRSEDRLRSAARILSQFSSKDDRKVRQSGGDERLRETRMVVGALREIAETMVWADQHEPSLWDTFMECSIMRQLLNCLRATAISCIGVEKPTDASPGRASGSDEGNVSKLETSQGGAKKEQLHSKIRSADHAGENLPNSTERQMELNPPPSQNSATEISFLSTGKQGEGARYAPPSEGATDVGITTVADQSSEQIALEIQSQVLQTLSIMIQSIFRQHSLLCLFSSNHINEILSFGFHFEDDEMLGYFMSAVKTIALKLDPALLQLFFDPSRGTFPLYNAVVRFFDHREQMVRIAVRNVTLTIYSLGDPEVLKFTARDESKYLCKTVDLLARLCGSVARGLELLMDDGREIRRTRSRTGIFRQKVRISEVAGKLEEVENLFAYLGDASSISKDILRPLIAQLLSTKLISPFFRPLASRASPRAIQLQKKWRLTNIGSDSYTPALPIFDAAARCLLLACIFETCRSSCLGHQLVKEVSRSLPEFEDRSVLHALKAMAADVNGTEKSSFASLCAIEAFILCDATTREMARTLKFDFGASNSSESLGAVESFNLSFSDREYQLEGEQRKSADEPLLMTLSEFEAPLTPANSLPPTPKYGPPSPSDSTTPPKGLARVVSAGSMSIDGLTFPKNNASDGILSRLERGDASLREMVSSIILVVRRREVRTLRILHAVCRVLDAVGSKANNHGLCVEVSKAILDEIAGAIQSFLRNKRTTIVSIERMFENFRSIAEKDVSEYTTVLSLDNILTPDAVPKIAGDTPSGAGKRRRTLKDDAIPPTETEDALALFIMLHAFEREVNNHNKVDMVQTTQVPVCPEDPLSVVVRRILLMCNIDESYLDKREALQDVATAVLQHTAVC